MQYKGDKGVSYAAYRNLSTNVHIRLRTRPSKTTSGYERKWWIPFLRS